MTKSATIDSKVNQDKIIKKSGYSVDDELKRTRLGIFVKNNKSTLVSFAIVLLVLAISVFAYFQRQQNLREDALNEATRFEMASIKSFQENKISDEQFWESFETYAKSFAKNNLLAKAIFADVIEIANKLVLKNKNDLAAMILEKYQGVYQIENHGFAIWAKSMAAIYENIKKEQQAIKLLEQLTQSPHKAFHAQAYLDLGRLHLALGERELAEKHLNYLKENFLDKTELVRLADIYLQGF